MTPESGIITADVLERAIVDRLDPAGIYPREQWRAAMHRHRSERYTAHDDPAVLDALLRRVWADVTGDPWPYGEP